MKDILKVGLLALLLIGGYIGYDQWRERQQCVELRRQFHVNMSAMSRSSMSAIEDSRRVGNQSPMLSLADRVEENRLVLNRLDAECPGWKEGRYGYGRE